MKISHNNIALRVFTMACLFAVASANTYGACNKDTTFAKPEYNICVAGNMVIGKKVTWGTCKTNKCSKLGCDTYVVNEASTDYSLSEVLNSNCDGWEDVILAELPANLHYYEAEIDVGPTGNALACATPYCRNPTPGD